MLTYESGQQADYLVYVSHSEGLIYDISVLFLGGNIAATYKLELIRVAGTDIFRIKSVKEVATSTTHEREIEDYKDLTGGSTSKVNETSSVTTTSTVTLIETSTTTITIRVYEHPISREIYLVYPNNTVINNNTKTIVSVDGGEKWVMSLFTQAITSTYVTKTTHVVYTYTKTGQSWNIYPNGTVTTQNGTFVTNGGIHQLITIITTRESRTGASYKIYVIKNTQEKFFVFEDGRVTDSTFKFICNGGLQCLQSYLTL